MRILIIDPLFAGDPDVEREITGPDADIVVWPTGERGAVPAGELRLADAVVNCRSRNRIDASDVASLDRCRIVSQAGVGFNHIDVEACAARGIPVCNTPDYGTMEVADHAIALMLSLTRGTVAYDRKLRDHHSGWVALGQTNVRRIDGRRFGVLGLGRIGLAAALRAKAFGMSVVFCDPYLAPGIERALGFRRVDDAGALFAAADVVSLHTPLTPETERIVDAAVLRRAKPGLLLVNTCRGRVVDLDALYASLRAEQIAGAGLDVLPDEPLTYGHPLIRAWAADEAWLDGRMVITPHAAFFSPDAVRDMRRLSMQTVVDFLRDGTLRACVNGGALRPDRGAPKAFG
ncbi:MAG: C-terminal binding protein [Pseudomonadota bacterium]